MPKPDDTTEWPTQPAQPAAADPPQQQPADPAAYLKSVKLWAIAVAAMTVYLLLGALIQRWVGPGPNLPPPPAMPTVVMVAPADTDPWAVTVCQPKAE